MTCERLIRDQSSKDETLKITTKNYMPMPKLSDLWGMGCGNMKATTDPIKSITISDYHKMTK